MSPSSGIFHGGRMRTLLRSGLRTRIWEVRKEVSPSAKMLITTPAMIWSTP